MVFALHGAAMKFLKIRIAYPKVHKFMKEIDVISINVDQICFINYERPETDINIFLPEIIMANGQRFFIPGKLTVEDVVSLINEGKDIL
jgi:hypothetical protein